MQNLTTRQERFVLNLFSGMTQRESWIQAGYSSNYPMAVVDKNACLLAGKSKIQVRLQELRDKAASERIMDIQERKERLSEIGRARLTDYQELGQDGGWINIGKESPNTAALSEITSTTKYDENGANPTLITRVRLHNPTQAIDLLNKMDKLYSEGSTVNIDNRKVEIYVADRETKQLVERLISGELPNKTNTDIQAKC